MKKLALWAIALFCGFCLVGCSSQNGNSTDMTPKDIVTDRNEILDNVINNLQNEIIYAEKDELMFSNGYMDSIDIKSKETAEILFRCIRNCVQIVDYTGVALQPMHLPILINGQTAGTFEWFYTEYPETGQFFGIEFSQEDSRALHEYVMALEHLGAN